MSQAEGTQLKYGWVRGGQSSYTKPLKAAEVFKANSGRFVADDTATGDVAVAADTRLLGHTDYVGTVPTGGEDAEVIFDPSAVFKIPVDTGTYAEAMKGDTCDLAVTSNIQGADLTASATDVIMVVGGDLTNNNFVEVVLNPTKLYASAIV